MNNLKAREGAAVGSGLTQPGGNITIKDQGKPMKDEKQKVA
jgi:hypothetical protein